MKSIITMNPGKMLTLTVNGVEHSLPLIPGETLAELLRQRLNLTGTKIGCNEAECGACTVLVNGDPILSCSYPAARAQGQEITTIEGLAELSESGNGSQGLHPLQQAFINYGAVQCGFCTPGQIMTAYALLQNNPDPNQKEVRDALKGALCRCGGYPAIERAVLAAANYINRGTSISIASHMSVEKNFRKVGRNLIRPDALQKVTGKAIYTDDLTFKHMLFARVRRAEVPHAILRGVDISQALVLPGVLAVLTAKDLPGERNHGLVSPDWPILVGVGERIRYVGDAVAILAAESEDIANQALELIKIEIDPQPVVTGPVEARQPQAPVLHERGNQLKHIQVRKGDILKGSKGS